MSVSEKITELTIESASFAADFKELIALIKGDGIDTTNHLAEMDAKFKAEIDTALTGRLAALTDSQNKLVTHLETILAKYQGDE